MDNFNSIEDLAKDIKSKLDKETTKKNVIALYAFNATGKTRLSNLLSGMSEDLEVLEDETGEEIQDVNGDKIWIKSGKIKTLCYNAFLEDMFIWDNENFVLKFDPNSQIIKLIVDEGLENSIIYNFKDIIDSHDVKIEPSFDFNAGTVVFKIASGDDASINNIKISKSEESIFIWSVFYTIVETAISQLTIPKENRSTNIFDDLEYIIIDDPVSSIDDTRIITLAVKLVYLIKNDHDAEYLKKTETEKEKVKFLLTTHHALYYNILVNSFGQKRKGGNFKSYILSRDNAVFKLKEHGDSPFSYHLSIKEQIQKAIHDDLIKRYHFNLFRALLEKTANFLGYENWYKCIECDKKQEFTKLLNLYSHSRLSDLESDELPTDHKDLFKKIFNEFVQIFK